jgi:ubiquinone/menaquinone biosynthesis C-methylase UbiE
MSMAKYLDYAEYYDFVTPFWDDSPLYLEYARGADSPVLELACGTGRVLLPWRRRALRYTA